MRLPVPAFLAAWLCVACSGSDGESNPKPPTSCDPSDRMGTYFVTFTTISGNCGPQDSALVSLDAASVQSERCSIISENVSENDCKVERHFTCPYDDLEQGAWIEFVGVSRQQTQDGSVITGTMTMRLRDRFDALVCSGTYDAHYERQ
jgi:hypothetical protein